MDLANPVLLLTDAPNQVEALLQQHGRLDEAL
jgi:hypothetical protein